MHKSGRGCAPVQDAPAQFLSPADTDSRHTSVYHEKIRTPPFVVIMLFVVSDM